MTDIAQPYARPRLLAPNVDFRLQPRLDGDALPTEFILGDFRIDVGGLKLLDSTNATRRLTPKTMGVLLELALRAGATVARDDLLSAVWPDTCPTPEVLTQAIKELRKAFLDDQKAPLYIETIPKIGYRLLKLPQWQPAGALATHERNASDQMPAAATTATLEPKSTYRKAPYLMLASIAAFLAFGYLWMNFASRPSNPAAHNNAESNQVWSQAKLADVKQSLRKLTSTPGIEHSPAISSDGKWLAYVAVENGQERIWVRDLASQDAKRLTNETESDPDKSHGTTPALNATRELLPRFSKDGLSIAFLRYSDAGSAKQTATNDLVSRCEIFAQRILGGAPRKLMDCPENFITPFDWPESNEILYSARTLDAGSSSLKPIQSVGIYSYSLINQTATRLASLPGEGNYDWQARRSPDRKWLAFRRGGNTDSTLFIADADGKNARALAQLAQGARGFDWLPDSSGVLASITQELAFGFVILRQNALPQSLGVAGQFPNIAADGRVVFSLLQERVGLFEFDLKKPNGKAVPLFVSTSVDESPSLSPDGKYIAFQSARGGIFQIWCATRSTVPEAVTQQSGRFSGIAWRADSSHFLVAQSLTGQGDCLNCVNTAMQEGSSLFEYEIERGRLREIKPPSNLGLIVRVAYGDENQTGKAHSYLILSSKEGKRHLQQWQSISTQTAQTTWQLDWEIADVGSFQKDAATNLVYFTRVANNTLFVRAPNGNTASVFNQFQPQFLWHWRVVNGIIYYSSANLTTGVMELRERVLNSAVDRPIRSMPSGDLALDVVRQTAIVPVPLNEEMDIVSFQLR